MNQLIQSDRSQRPFGRSQRPPDRSKRSHARRLILPVFLMMLAGALCSLPLVAQVAVPLGGEFQVNTFTTSYQLYPSVGVARDGSFVVVWMSLGSPEDDNDGLSIQGQRYNSAGTAVGPQFQVNTYVTGYQRYPAVDAAENGAFVVAWQSANQDGDGDGIFARRYNSLGMPLSDDFQVNSTTAGNQNGPTVAVNEFQETVIAWQDSGLDGDGSGIVAQRFDGAGSPIGGEFQVNTYTTGEQTFPSAGLNDEGTLVITWQSDEQSPDHDIRSRFGSMDDGMLGLTDVDCRTNSTTTDDQSRPAAAIDNSGQAIIAWQDRRNGTDYDVRRSVVTRVPGDTCVPGNEQQVHEPSSNDQFRPTAAAIDSGQFMVVWLEGGVNNVLGRHFESPSMGGPEFVINTSPEASLRPWVDFDEGGIVAAWTLGLAADEVLARRYTGTRFFGDGFESGDTSAWSASVP